MKSKTSQVTIVGAGPAGLSAAIQLAEFNIKSTIVDENPEIGGAIFKQPDKGLDKSLFRNEKTYIRAKKLFDEFFTYQSYVNLQLGSEVLGDFSLSNELAFLHNDKVKTLPNNPVIICTGCYERAQPFPGWTLPGIMSVGGIQLQTKCGNVKPGHKIALVGTGPLLLVAAKQLHQAGIKVVGVVEAGLKKDLIKNMFTLFYNTKLLKEGFSYINYMKNNKIPIFYGHGVVSARGNNELEELVIAPYTKEWKPIQEKSFSIQVDSAGIGYGYVPRIQLTQMLKCEHEFNANIGGFYPKVDHWQRTTIEGVYVAGDNGGIYGSEVALHQGRIAALAYLIDNKKITVEKASRLIKKNRKKMNNLKKFQSSFDNFSGLKSGLLTLPDSDTIVCRCEHVKMESIDVAINSGVKNMTGLKIRTRVGMGDCQGKMCGSFCAEYLSYKLGDTREKIGAMKPRFPMSPIPFSSITNKELEYEK
jgi:hydrogen cyanide synthase HcnB